ncbi:putative transcription factor C2H2 family [Helianthus annuus]|nr:putative transcription factor C2H2 family [Helianthus annuus]
MGLQAADLVEDQDDVKGGKGAAAAASVSCSICLEVVVDDSGDRAWARLQCGHRFHLGYGLLGHD